MKKILQLAVSIAFIASMFGYSLSYAASAPATVPAQVSQTVDNTSGSQKVSTSVLSTQPRNTVGFDVAAGMVMVVAGLSGIVLLERL